MHAHLFGSGMLRSPGVKLLVPYLARTWSKLVLALVTTPAYSVASVLPAFITQRLLDDGLTARSFRTVVLCAAALLLAAILRSALSILATKLFATMGQTVAADMRTDMMERALSMPLDWLSDKDSGYISSRVNEASNVSMLFSQTNFAFLGSLFQAFIAVGLLASISLPVFLLCLLPVPLYLLCAHHSIGQYRAVTKEALEIGASLSGKMNETLGGREEVRVNGSIKREKGRLAAFNQTLKAKGIRQALIAVVTGEGMKTLTTLSTSLVYIVCGWYVVNSSLTIGQLVAAVQYASQMYSPILVTVSVSLMVQPALSSLGRIADTFYQDEGPTRGSVEMGEPSSIVVSDLRFTWPGSNGELFGGLSFSLTSPSLVVVRGQNGSGKTTLAKILLGLVSNWAGSVKVDGVPLQQISEESWRERCATVSQRPFLANATIRDNVAFSGEDYEQAAYESAVRLSGLDGVLERLPDGDATVVGEGAKKLSGGERQKVSLARALLRGASVLILDEPTTSLDQGSSLELKGVVRHLSESGIVVVIEHTDLSDDIADKVVRL